MKAVCVVIAVYEVEIVNMVPVQYVALPSGHFKACVLLEEYSSHPYIFI